jgi:cytochrome P450
MRQLFTLMLHGSPETDQETEEEFFSRVLQARAELDEMLLQIIRHRRDAPSDDILGTLVSAYDETGRASPTLSCWVRFIFSLWRVTRLRPR